MEQGSSKVRTRLVINRHTDKTGFHTEGGCTGIPPPQNLMPYNYDQFTITRFKNALILNTSI